MSPRAGQARSWLWASVGRLRPYALPLGIAAAIGALSVSRILERAGEPALPLDDAFIHLQFARRLSEGHWFDYTLGGGYSSGATSMLWPLCIAPVFALGADGLAVVWWVWLLGWLAHGAVALEAARLAGGLGGRLAGYAAGAMCLAFGAFAWFAYSGMETMAITWILVRGARVAAERCEPAAERLGWSGPRPSAWQLCALGVMAPLVRPEGALISLLAVLVALRELFDPRSGRGGRAARLVLPAAGPAILPALHWFFAGHAASATATVKWLALDPYLTASEVLALTLDNVHLLLTDLLDGGAWTVLFVPEHFVIALALGVVAMTVLAYRHKRFWRLGMVLLLLGGTLLPASYDTMLWNRVRYIWPFAPAWFVAVACLCGGLGALLGRLHPRAGMLAAALAGAAVALFGAQLDWASSDLAQSARAISLQQVALGRWAAEELPADATIGVNDTGAIAYMSARRTFDVVGLTTEGEARYWAEGAGSRFEHYERLGAARLPTHFIVYPEWLAMPAVLGPALTHATVLDQSILGGKTMVAYEARYDALGSGALPLSAPATELYDELDVADLESEAAHQLERGDARARFNLVRSVYGPAGEIFDGGRIERVEDRFLLAGGGEAQLILRVRCELPLEVWVGAERIGEAPPGERGPLDDPAWDERVLHLPAAAGPRRLTVRPTGRVRFDSFHYWLYAAVASPPR